MPAPQRFDRRSFLARLGAGWASAAAIGGAPGALAQPVLPAQPVSPSQPVLPVKPLAPDQKVQSLKARAAAKGIRFGTEALFWELHEPRYAELVARECSILVPGWEAKWDKSEPEDGVFDFGQMDWMVDFAQSHDMAVRGHNLVWSLAMPPWLKPAIAEGRGEEVLKRHIAKLVGRYRGKIDSWDVVNEPSDPRWHLGPEGLTMTEWRQALGPHYPEFAFALAHAADPAAKLFVNDANLEGDTPQWEAKRDLYRKLLSRWLAAGVPIAGFGLQTHLVAGEPFRAAPYRKFLADLAAMGLTLYITEMDVIDKNLPADIPSRDAKVAECCRQVLDVALDEPALKVVMTWGLTDASTWMNDDPIAKRADGAKARGLPFDDRLNPKPMYEAIGAALDAARAR